MATSTIEDTAVRYAYDSIHDFFDNYSLREAVKEISGVVKAATHSKAWKKDSAYSLIYFMEKLEALCGAALVLHYSFGQREACILVSTDRGDPDLSRQQAFVIRNPFSSPWNNMPRHLNAAQYYNPYKAIRKFARCMAETEWKKALKALTACALDNSSIDDEYSSYDILTIQKHLLLLIEACHLLEVRSNLQIANPKPSKKKSKK